MSGVETELRTAWQLHIGNTRAGIAEYESVIARHREPHRRYHGVAHVRWVLRHVATLVRDGEVVTDRDAVGAAAFYHDAVYDTLRADNERASARLASRALAELGWDAVRVSNVADLVMATATHTDVGGDPAVLVDADLAVLGADPAGYRTYCTGVRYEFRHLDDTAWSTGRSAVLRNFLRRDQIFATSSGRARWELTARSNITAELAALDGAIGGR